MGDQFLFDRASSGERRGGRISATGPQIEQSDRDLARLVLEQAIRDNGESFKAGYVYVAGIAPFDRRNETWKAFKAKYPGVQEVATFGTMDNPIAGSVAAQARLALAGIRTSP